MSWKVANVPDDDVLYVVENSMPARVPFNQLLHRIILNSRKPLQLLGFLRFKISWVHQDHAHIDFELLLVQREIDASCAQCWP